MDIFIFIKLLVNAQSLCPASDKCHRRLAGLLHYIAEIARKLDLAAAVEHCDLDIKHLAADGGPCKTSNKADLICVTATLGLKFLRTEVGL